MLKRILLITGLFMVIFGTSCFAENWKEIYNDGNNITFIDTDSMRKVVLRDKEIVKLRTKMVTSSKSYFVYHEWYNADNKDHRTVLTELYDANDNLKLKNDESGSPWVKFEPVQYMKQIGEEIDAFLERAN